MSCLGVDIGLEEPLPTAVRPRGCRAGRREQQRRRSQSTVAPREGNGESHRVDSLNTQDVIASVEAAGDHPEPISVTLSDEGRDVALIGARRVLSTDVAVYEPHPTARRSLQFCDAIELIGAVYDAARTRIIGEMTLYGQPATGTMSMGSRFSRAPPTNATFLATVDPFDCIPDDTTQTAHAFVALVDVHRRIPRGMLWFDRGDATWSTEMEMSHQPGALVHHGNRRIHVVFVRPMN